MSAEQVRPAASELTSKAKVTVAEGDSNKVSSMFGELRALSDKTDRINAEVVLRTAQLKATADDLKEKTDRLAQKLDDVYRLCEQLRDHFIIDGRDTALL